MRSKFIDDVKREDLRKMSNKLHGVKRKHIAKRKLGENNTDLVELCWLEGN